MRAHGPQKQLTNIKGAPPKPVPRTPGNHFPKFSGFRGVRGTGFTNRGRLKQARQTGLSVPKITPQERT